MPKMMMDAERNQKWFEEFREQCPVRKQNGFYCRIGDCRCDETSMKDCGLFSMALFISRKIQG